jgi:hypothetical protein
VYGSKTFGRGRFVAAGKRHNVADAAATLLDAGRLPGRRTKIEELKR